MVHVLNHALTKGGMFMVLGIVIYRLGGATLDHLRGLGKRMPVTAAAFTLGGLGLIGVPGTAGSISKWYLVQGALQDNQWTLAVLILVGSMLAVVYVWRVIEVIYLQEPDPELAEGYFRAALERRPSYGEALLQLSLLKFSSEDFLGARAFLQRYLSGNVPTASILYLGVRIEEELGDDRARTDYSDQILRDFPQSPEARQILESG